MSLPAKQWNHIGLLSQRPSPDKLPVGYTYLASDLVTGFEIDVTASGTHFWQEVFCKCWNTDVVIASVKNISLVNQTLPAVYGSYVLTPGLSALVQDDPSMTAIVLKQNGLDPANFLISQLAPSVPLDVAVYVDGTNGNDANPGTQSQPVATVRQGLRLWPRSFLRSCNMFVTGTTNEIGDIIVYPPEPIGPDAQPPCIIGSMIDVGLGVLRVASFVPNVQPTPTGGGDAVTTTTGAPFSSDLYAGEEMLMLTGNIAGRAYTLMSNDTTTFYLPHASHYGQPAANDTLMIRKPNSTITLSGRFEIRSSELAMYGLNIASSAFESRLIINGGTLYADSVRISCTFTGVIGQGAFIPGQAHNLCVFPGGPAPSLGTLGAFASTSIVAYSGQIGDFRLLVADNVTGPNEGLVNGVLVMRVGALFAEGAIVNLFVADLVKVWLLGCPFFNIVEHWRINGSPDVGLTAQGPGYISVSQVDISDCVGDGISLSDGAHIIGFGISGGNVAGHPNGGVGLRTTYGAHASVSDPHAYSPVSTFTCITGTGGDVKVGANTVDNWTNIAAANAAHTTDFNASSTGVAASQGCRVGA